MSRKISFFILLIAMLILLSFSAFAHDTEVEADDVSDITSAIENAQIGDTVSVKLISDITLNSQITINKDITVNVSFNTYQLSYNGNAGSDSSNAILCLDCKDATLNLNGSNSLASSKEYVHYGDTVTADMTGNANLVVIYHGNLNISNMYMLAPSNAFCINSPITSGNQTVIKVNNSVLRNFEAQDGTATFGAITIQGAKSYERILATRQLFIDDSVVYGGFNGLANNFNVTRGSAFTNVRFYNFYIKNDSWYSIADGFENVIMSSLAHALPITNCEFLNSDGTPGTVKVLTYTGKQNISLIGCTFASIDNAGCTSDGGGDACIYVLDSIDQMPTCYEAAEILVYRKSNAGANENLTIPHSYVYTVEYDDGYNNNGYGLNTCTVAECGYKQNTGTTYYPIIENLGYSYLDGESGSITLGTKIHRDRLEAYQNAMSHLKIDFGFAVGVENMTVDLADGNVIVTNGKQISCASLADNYVVFDLKVVNITEEYKDKKIAMEFYMSNGNKVSFSNGSEVKYRSYNEIVEEISKAYLNWNLEDFDVTDNGTTIESTGYNGGALTGSVVATVKDGSLEIIRDTAQKNNFEVYIKLTEDKSTVLEEYNYLLVWVDFTNTDFRKACFGLLSGSTVYRTDDYDRDTPFYYLADGSDMWQTMYHGNDGCFGREQKGSVNGLKGYLALPVEYFKGITSQTTVTGIYFYGDVTTGYANQPFYFDNFRLVGDYLYVEI